MGSIWCHVRHDNMCRPIGVPFLGYTMLVMIDLRRLVAGCTSKMYPHFWQQIKALQSHLEYVIISPGRENEQIQFKPGLSIKCLKINIKIIKQKGEETMTMTLQSITFNI